MKERKAFALQLPDLVFQVDILVSPKPSSIGRQGCNKKRQADHDCLTSTQAMLFKACSLEDSLRASFTYFFFFFSRKVFFQAKGKKNVLFWFSSYLSFLPVPLLSLSQRWPDDLKAIGVYCHHHTGDVSMEKSEKMPLDQFVTPSPSGLTWSQLSLPRSILFIIDTSGQQVSLWKEVSKVSESQNQQI